LCLAQRDPYRLLQFLANLVSVNTRGDCANRDDYGVHVAVITNQTGDIARTPFGAGKNHGRIDFFCEERSNVNVLALKEASQDPK
jgi:hypothetical protein